MRDDEDSSTDSDQKNTLNTLKKFQKRIANIDDPTGELMDVGLVIFMWSGVFFLLNLIFGWLGFFQPSYGPVFI